jgi:hypothetical protein
MRTNEDNDCEVDDKTDAEIGPDIGKLFAILVAEWQKRLPNPKLHRN